MTVRQFEMQEDFDIFEGILCDVTNAHNWKNFPSKLYEASQK
jgi:hypothetical protein